MFVHEALKVPRVLFLLLVIGFALCQPLNPPSPAPTPQVDACLIHDGCSQCVLNPGCVWCLNTGNCRSASNCGFTGYTDCCVLFKSCLTCIESPSCGYCSVNSVCQAGNETQPKGSKCAVWHFSSCPNSNSAPSFPIGFVILLTIGFGVVMVAIILLFLFVRRIIRQKQAQHDIFEYYQPSKSICDFCQDGIATEYCKNCKLKLCSHCSVIEDLHPPGTNHTLKPLQLDSEKEKKAKPPLDRENAYTSFASLLQSKNGAGSMGPYGSVNPWATCSDKMNFCMDMIKIDGESFSKKVPKKCVLTCFNRLCWWEKHWKVIFFHPWKSHLMKENWWFLMIKSLLNLSNRRKNDEKWINLSWKSQIRKRLNEVFYGDWWIFQTIIFHDHSF